MAEKERKRRKMAGDQTTPDPSYSGGEKEHKKNWRETLATAADIRQMLTDNVLLRQNVITGRPEFRVPRNDEFDTVGRMYYPSGASPLDEWRSATVWYPVSDRFVNTLWSVFSDFKDVRLRDIWTVINSDFVPLFNPLRQYLESLPPPDDGRAAIFELSMTVTVKGGTDDQALFYLYLRKWLVGMVAGWVDEAYRLYRDGFQYWFTDEETEVLKQHNERFEVPNMEQELISKYYHLPGKNVQGEFVSTTEILQTIGGNLMPRLTANKVGRVMKDLGFRRIRSHGRWGYVVVAYSAGEIKENRSMLAYDAESDRNAELF